MGALIRIVQSLPLLVALAILAVVIYLVVSWLHSPLRAKEILIKVFLVLTIALSVIFALATLYSLIETNTNTAGFFGAFLAIAVIALIVTLVCRYRFLKHHPNYRYSPQFARTHFRWEKTLRQILKMLGNGPFTPRS